MNKSVLVKAMLVLSGAVCAYSAALARLHFAIGEPLRYCWILAFSVLLALWVHVDTRTRSIHQPLDFGFLFLGFCPLALPYYLIKTRGARGVMPCAGFFAAYLAPFFLARGVYAVSSTL